MTDVDGIPVIKKNKSPHLSRNVVEVDGVYKKFSSTRSGSRRNLFTKAFCGFFNVEPNRIELQDDEFWALQDISFQLARGKTLGVLGLNGAGKTTLLNIVGGMITPDEGHVKTAGAIGALMNLSAGLQPALSARENILIGGAVRGWSMEETLAKYDDIVDFAELGAHMSRRLVDFSSGMRMRLAFSIAIHMNPDLLLIDEVLAVGDHRFRNKCQKKIKEITSDASVIIVSHSIRDIRDYCDECLLLRDGKQLFYGDVETALGMLLDSYHDVSIKAGSDITELEGRFSESFQADGALKNVSLDWNIIKDDKQPKTLVCSIDFEALESFSEISVGIALHMSGYPNLLSAASSLNQLGFITLNKGERTSLQLSLDLAPLNPGYYDTDIVIVSGNEVLYRSNLAKFEKPDWPYLSWGAVTLKSEWKKVN